MALIKCLGCGANISDKAIVCPKCGRKNLVENKSDKDSLKEKPISNSEVKSFNLKYIVGAIFISLLSVFLLAYLSDDNSNDSENTETTRIDFTHNFQSDFINLGIINSNSSTKNSFFTTLLKLNLKWLHNAAKIIPF